MSKLEKNAVKRKDNLNISNDDFESPVVFKKFKSNGKNTTKPIKKKKPRDKKQLTLHQVYEENFRYTDVNSEHLQLALALSRSTYEENNHTKEEFPLNEGKKKTLLEFGFKSDKPKINVKNKLLKREPVKKNKKSKFRFVTPILMIRTNEERESLIQSKLSSILVNNTDISCDNKYSNLDIASKELEKLRCPNCSIFNLNNIKSGEYVVKCLNIEAGRARIDSLLKDWKTIPLRDHTPERIIKSVEITNTEHSSPGNADKNESISTCNNINCHTRIDEKLETDNNFDARVCLNYQDGSVSPDLFENDASFCGNSSVKKNLNNIFTQENSSNKIEITNISAPNEALLDCNEPKRSGNKTKLENLQSEETKLNISQFELKQELLKNNNSSQLIDEDIIVLSSDEENSASNDVSTKFYKQDDYLNITQNYLKNSENEDKNVDAKKSFSISGLKKMYSLSDEEIDFPSEHINFEETNFNSDEKSSKFEEIKFGKINESSDSSLICSEFNNDISKKKSSNSQNIKDLSKKDVPDENNSFQFLNSDFNVENFDSKINKNLSEEENGFPSEHINFEETNFNSTKKSSDFEESKYGKMNENLDNSLNCSEFNIDISKMKSSNSQKVKDLRKKDFSDENFDSEINNENLSEEETDFPTKHINFKKTIFNFEESEFRKINENSDNSFDCSEFNVDISEMKSSNSQKIKYLSKKDIPEKNSSFQFLSSNFNVENFDSKINENLSEEEIVFPTEHINLEETNFNSNERSSNFEGSEFNTDISKKKCTNSRKIKDLSKKDIPDENFDSEINNDNFQQCSKNSSTCDAKERFNNTYEILSKQKFPDSQKIEDLMGKNIPEEMNSSFNNENFDFQINYENFENYAENLSEKFNDSEEKTLDDDKNCDNQKSTNTMFSDTLSDSLLDKLLKENSPHVNKSKECSDYSNEEKFPNDFWFDEISDSDNKIEKNTFKDESKSIQINTPNQETKKKCGTPFRRYASYSENTPKKSNFTRHKSESNVTPNDKFIIKKDNVTPMIDYNSLSTPEVVQELGKFGLKPLKRKRGINLLRHIYETTHPKVGKSVEDVPETKRRKSEDLAEGRKRDEKGHLGAYSGSLLESDVILEKQRSSKIPTCQVPLQIVWHNFLNENPDIFENILLYEPLQVEVIHKMLKELGFKFHLQDLITFLDQKCITIRVAQSQGKLG